jgi:hypothetical protein
VPPPFSLRRFAEAIAQTLQEGARRPGERDDRWGEARMIADYDAVLTDALRGSAA